VRRERGEGRRLDLHDARDRGAQTVIEPLALSVVVPAFNEASRIGDTLAELRRTLPSMAESWEVRVVDDGSHDETAHLVADAAAEDHRIVLQCEAHRGKGAAVRAGLLAARGELRFMCDADLSMPLDELPKFLALVPAQCDIAIGSREGPGARRVGEPLYRHLVGRAFNYVVRAGRLGDIQDTQCGFKLFSRQAVDTVFPRTTIDGWAFDIEVLWIARHAGLRVTELPIEWHYRERSRVSIVRDSLRMVNDVWRVRFNAMRGKYDG